MDTEDDLEEGEENMAEDVRVSKAFIEALPGVPPLYVSIYLMTKAIDAPDAALVADRLDVLKSDVLKAWQYWENLGFLTERAHKTEDAPKQTRVFLESRPEYGLEELAECMKHAEMKRLAVCAQRKLGKLLSQQDINMLYGFYDWLGLPVDVIELLLSYCVSNGKTGMRYIEKVAIGWADEGIDTVEQAAEYIELRKSGFKSILQAFGVKDRGPVKKEIDFMVKWMREYRFSLDVIKFACERAVSQTGKVSFSYADGILRRWKDAGVSVLSDVEVLDKAFDAKKAISQANPAPKAQKQPEKKNRFINYTQREWDFEKIDEMRKKKRDQW